ncbi:carboxymuconolactone decarboxylase family protein [Natrinema salifodinae]|uniref:4-carboxymuconolactone decarboxylase n=1 Tax=Natrinema salifodinae TaxID=1202768 RepID=A0A1I0MG95_9EURY|nr:carboxymuconolactone decarboxylase family protein [Natrinema salifodinae]SEV86491.1 4-carboxymuconolactone decarboxylase [Natrinema salifodinae]
MDERSPRIPTISTRDELPPNQRDRYDSIAEGRDDVSGPFPVLLQHPELAERVGRLGAYVRFESALAGRERELAILATAREFDCAYEWVFHEPIARREGVPTATIDAVATDDALDAVPDADALVVRYVRALLRDHGVSERTFRRAEERFGVRGLVELTATAGYYAMLACVLNAFEVRPDESPPFRSAT